VLINNFKTTKGNYEDYKDMTDDEVYEVFEDKISNLKEIYEPLELGAELPFIKIYNMGRSVEINKVHGFMATNVLKFLCGLRAYSRPIWFSRHGQSQFNVTELIGGDSLLSENGRKYGLCLQQFFKEYTETPEGKEEVDNMTKFCSTLTRTQQTISYLDEFGKEAPFVKKELDEINAGICDSMTYEEINEKYPREYNMRLEDKLNYRYPRGESYIDLISRLEPFVLEVESHDKPLFIVSHQATLRCLYAYFESQKVDNVPYISVELHTLIRFEPGIMGYKQTTYKFDIETGDYTTEVKEVNYNSDLPKRMRFRTTDSDQETDETGSNND
jgi:broad specificity phosphatase PhoE